MWSVDDEIALFEALFQNKPIGPQKNAKMIAIMTQLEKRIPTNCPTTAQVWQHLEEMYDLDILEKLNTARTSGADSTNADQEDSDNETSHTKRSNVDSSDESVRGRRYKTASPSSDSSSTSTRRKRNASPSPASPHPLTDVGSPLSSPSVTSSGSATHVTKKKRQEK